jgi:hypothetical protein
MRDFLLSAHRSVVLFDFLHLVLLCNHGVVFGVVLNCYCWCGLDDTDDVLFCLQLHCACFRYFDDCAYTRSNNLPFKVVFIRGCESPFGGNCIDAIDGLLLYIG